MTESLDPAAPPAPAAPDSSPAGFGFEPPAGGYAAAPGYTAPTVPTQFGSPVTTVRTVPTSVRAVSILEYIAAALGALFGLISLVGGAALGGLVGHAGAGFVVGLAVAVVFWAFAAAYVVLARMLPTASRPARMASVILAGLGVLFGLVRIGDGFLSSLLTIVLNGGIIYLLMFEAKAKAFFGDT